VIATIILYGIIERLFNPFLDLVTGNFTKLPIFGIFGLLTIILASILTFHLVLNAYRRIKSALSTRAIRFYASRKDLPELETRLLQAKREIGILGITLEYLSRQYADIIKQLLCKGVHMKFLTLNPNSELVGRVEKAMATTRVKEAIIASLETLCLIKQELGSIEKSRVEIRTFDLLPIHSIIVVDPNSDDANILVESYLYNTDPRSRSIIIVSKRDNEAVYMKYWNSYRFVLENSEKYKCG
jgi:hypothetical protein